MLFLDQLLKTEEMQDRVGLNIPLRLGQINSNINFRGPMK